MKESIVSFMLRYQKTFYVVAIVLLIGVFVCPLIMRVIDRRVKYDWNEYSNRANPLSKEPFGAYYVDEYLRKTWNDKFEVDSSLCHAMKKHAKERCNYMVFTGCDILYEEPDSAKLYYSALKIGSNFIFTNDVVSPALINRIYRDNGTSSFYIENFNKENEYLHKVPVRLKNTSGKNSADTCRVWNNMFDCRLSVDSIETDEFDSNDDREFNVLKGKYENTLVDNIGNCYVLTFKTGKGKALIDGTRFLFCNYGMGESDIWKLNEKIFNQTFDKSLPLVVIYISDEDRYGSSDNGEEMMFSVLLKNPATRLALYVLLAMLLLWILVNSRRRRCAEETLPQEHNSSIGYVEHLATLYTATSDYRELLVLEQRKLLYRFRKEYRFDIRTNDFTLPSEYAEIVAQSKGYDEAKVRAALLQLEALTNQTDRVGRNSYTICMRDLLLALRKKD